MNINDYLLTSLRDGQSAEDLAKDLSSALQAAEKQLAEEKRLAEEAEAKKKLCEQSSQLKTNLCDALRNYINCVHPQIYDKLININGKDFTNDEIIEIIDNTIKNTALAFGLYESIADFCGETITKTKNCDKEATKITNWEKLFNDFFDKYNL